MNFWKNQSIYLRLVNEEDEALFRECFEDSEMRKQADGGVALPVTDSFLEEMLEYVSNVSEDEEIWFAICKEEDKNPVGYLKLDWLDQNNGKCALSVNILKEHRRQHYGTMAVNKALEYIFNQRRFHKVTANVLEKNIPGQKFMESLGFKADAHRKELYFIDGNYQGEYYYSILENEFYLESNPDGNPDSNILIENEKLSDTAQIKNLKSLIDEKKSSSFSDFSNISDISGTHYVSEEFTGRQNFWKYEDIQLKAMTEEYYLLNREILNDREDSVRYDCEVKQPEDTMEISGYEESHIDFGGDDDRYDFAILNSENQYVGNINMCGIDKRNGKFSFSIYILRNFRGRGYSKKALKIILDYGFNEMRLNRMISTVNQGNIPSAKLMLGVGCEYEGMLRDNNYYEGEYHGTWMFGVSRKEFMKMI